MRERERDGWNCGSAGAGVVVDVDVRGIQPRFIKTLGPRPPMMHFPTISDADSYCMSPIILHKRKLFL
jgi:hypothetical protein